MAGTGTEETVGQTEEKEKRVVKPTLKGLELKLQMKISLRRAILGQLTEKRNELCALMDDDANAEHIGKEPLAEYVELIKEFSEINEQVKDLFCQTGYEENMNTDQRDWFEPKNSEHTDFAREVNSWTLVAKKRQEKAKTFSDEIKPEDSMSVTSKKSKKSKSVSAASATSSARSERELGRRWS